MMAITPSNAKSPLVTGMLLHSCSPSEPSISIVFDGKSWKIMVNHGKTWKIWGPGRRPSVSAPGKQLNDLFRREWRGLRTKSVGPSVRASKIGGISKLPAALEAIRCLSDH